MVRLVTATAADFRNQLSAWQVSLREQRIAQHTRSNAQASAAMQLMGVGFITASGSVHTCAGRLKPHPFISIQIPPSP